MELCLTDDQKLVRETTQRFIADTCDLSVVRRIADGGAGLTDAYLPTAAEIGWFSMLVDEDRGGGSVSGEGLRDLAIITQERGRTLQPGRFIGSNVVAQTLGAVALSGAGDATLAEVMAGESTAAWAMGADAWSPGPGIEVTSGDGDGFRLDGEVRMVPDAPDAGCMIVTGRHGAGTSQFLVSCEQEGLSVDVLDALDISQGFGTVRFHDAQVPASALLGDAHDAGERIERQLRVALVLIVAETVGAADALLSLTTDYAKDRTAFGRPIGSFQALKHQLADLALSLEAAKAITVQATRSVQAQSPDAATMASIAKAWASEVAVDIAQGCLQVFGGIGYTWEHDLHLYLRRLTLNSQLYGSARWHRQRIWASQQQSRVGENA